jgi:hypothetical protein
MFGRAAGVCRPVLFGDQLHAVGGRRGDSKRVRFVLGGAPLQVRLVPPILTLGFGGGQIIANCNNRQGHGRGRSCGGPPCEDPISFRIKAEIRQALERLARVGRRSLSQYIELALEAHVAAKKHEGKKPKTRS